MAFLQVRGPFAALLGAIREIRLVLRVRLIGAKREDCSARDEAGEKLGPDGLPAPCAGCMYSTT
jgi:hypothetical protein